MPAQCISESFVFSSVEGRRVVARFDGARLQARIARETLHAEATAKAAGSPAHLFADFPWTARDSWSRARRVVAKAEWTRGKANPCFAVTSLAPAVWQARALHEDLYCRRDEIENRIKECQLDLFAIRAPARTMRANQLRLWFAATAYVLLRALRRIDLARTRLSLPPVEPSAQSCSRSEPR